MTEATGPVPDLAPGSTSGMPAARSMLFLPGARADMVAKIPRFAPDVAVVDLEDAVAADAKEAARGVATAAIDELGDTGATLVLVRVNPPGSPGFADDVEAVAGCAAAGIVVPKLDSLAQVEQVREELDRHEWSTAILVGGIETVLGVADSRALLAEGLSAVYFGAEDYVADIGGRRSAAGEEVLYARSQVVLAAHLAGIPAIDQAVVDIGDDEAFRDDAGAGSALGYQGKICIHPRQVELAHELFCPSPEEVEQAREVVAAGEQGVGLLDGRMVDEVHVRMARRVLARAR